MKKQKQIQPSNPFDLLSEEIVFIILDLISHNPSHLKSFSLTCKYFFHVESKYRRTLKPLRSDYLPRLLSRYPNTSHLDLTFCPRVPDSALRTVAQLCGPTLRSLDLSRSGAFSAAGLLSVSVKCVNLVEIDLSNATEMRDAAAAVVAEARNLERLKLGRCKLLTDMGIGCIAVGCRKLSLVSLKWCVGVGDLGVGLLAVKCKDIRSLDLSYLPITGKCLHEIMKLQHLEELLLEGCFGIDDDSLSSLTHECNSLQRLDVSSCQNLTPKGLTFLLNGAKCLQQLVLPHASSVISSDFANCLKKISILQSITLDGCLVTCDGLKAISISCNALKELSLSKCVGVTDEGLSSIVMKRKDLRKLDITCCRKLSGASIAQIANSCPNLISLKMESCSLVPREAFVLIGLKCRFLQELDLTDNEIDDEGLKSISGCLGLSSLKLGICLNITDKGLSYIGTACSNLLELDLYRSMGITDVGVSWIARGCSKLESINISYCKDITDKSLVSLSKCCSRLTIFECRGCPLVTSLGLAAIAEGCKGLSKLDVKKCQNINDSAMLTLAHHTRSLKQINVSETGVRDVGLMWLGNIACLQNVAVVVQASGLTASGLTAFMLACGALKKLKLHVSFKTLLPPPLIHHIEARGCSFFWKDQNPQAELDPKYWKLQLEDFVP